MKHYLILIFLTQCLQRILNKQNAMLSRWDSKVHIRKSAFSWNILKSAKIWFFSIHLNTKILEKSVSGHFNIFQTCCTFTDAETSTESKSRIASCTSENEEGHVLCSMARGALNDVDIPLDHQGPPKFKNKTQWSKVCVSFTRSAYSSLISVSSLRLMPLQAIPKVQPVSMSLSDRNSSWRSLCSAILKVENAKTKLA